LRRAAILYRLKIAGGELFMANIAPWASFSRDFIAPAGGVIGGRSYHGTTALINCLSGHKDVKIIFRSPL